jgi:quinol monooxygenase YgiN
MKNIKGRQLGLLKMVVLAVLHLCAMLIRIVRMTFEPENVPAFLAIFRASEERIRQQPGCQFMELWQDANDPAIYCTHSRWDDEAALNTYRKSALFGEVWPATKRLFAASAVAFSSIVAPTDANATGSKHPIDSLSS